MQFTKSRATLFFWPKPREPQRAPFRVHVRRIISVSDTMDSAEGPSGHDQSGMEPTGAAPEAAAAPAAPAAAESTMPSGPDDQPSAGSSMQVVVPSAHYNLHPWRS